ncbi:MAG: hypothetical protein JNL01_02390 [Bdellovibrionales bacterium]|nr:hypothetical protein [Bdellovibrionales bacterium]
MLSLLAFLSACPDLSGTYSCPKDGLVPEFDLTIVVKRLKKKRTHYEYQYSVFPTSTTVASKKGIENKVAGSTAFVASCSKKKLIYKIPSLPKFEQITELDEDKNLKVTVGGKPRILCIQK